MAEHNLSSRLKGLSEFVADAAHAFGSSLAANSRGYVSHYSSGDEPTLPPEDAGFIPTFRRIREERRTKNSTQ